MRPLDAEAYQEALEPPRFTVGTRTFTGRVLSVFEQAAFDVRFAKLAAGALSEQDASTLMREYLEALFPSAPEPPDPRARWARWLWACTRVFGTPPPPPTLTPVDVFLALPIAAQMQGLADFAQSRRTIPQPPGSGVAAGESTTKRRTAAAGSRLASR